MAGNQSAVTSLLCAISHRFSRSLVSRNSSPRLFRASVSRADRQVKANLKSSKKPLDGPAGKRDAII